MRNKNNIETTARPERDLSAKTTIRNSLGGSPVSALYRAKNEIKTPGLLLPGMRGLSFDQ